MASSRLGETVRSIHLLFSGKSVAGQGDAALLRRFVANRDEAAFNVLVARHGPMVCAVCRDVLRDSHDVEDAFQATFLILARRAGSLWVDESLGGWLYRVAYHVAIKANREASRRRAREQGGIDLATFPEQDADNRHAAELHEAIARLPERYRRALVLCHLEGMPQLEAARVLNCGEATLRRRLAGARDRLRTSLAVRGIPPMTLGRIGGGLPAGWAETTSRIALGLRPATTLATRLASSTVHTSLMAKSVRLMLVLGLVSAAGATYAFTRPEDPKPAPPIQAAKIPPAVVPAKTIPIKWIHLKSDNGEECWANLEAGLEFHRNGKTVSMLDVAKHDLLTYKGTGAIEKSEARWYGNIKDKQGRQIPPSVFELWNDLDRDIPSRAPEDVRKSQPVFWDYDFDTLDGKKTIRRDQYQRDALGVVRLEQQVWYDAETKRPLRKRSRYQVAYQEQYKKEFETTDFDYPETGPADLAALGVPRDTPVVDPEAKRRSYQWAAQTPEVQQAITRQAEAIRKFPRDLRVVTEDFHGTLQLEYWSAKDEFVDLWCKTRTSDDQYALNELQPRHFRADNQDVAERPRTILRPIIGPLTGEFDADRVAAWFPFDKSVNISLVDGKVNFHLTRFFTEPGQPRRTEVHVLTGGFDDFPKFFEQQWQVINENRRDLVAIPSESDTPPGMIVIRSNGELHRGDEVEPYPQIFTLDPAHDYIAVRQVVWQRLHSKEKWQKSDVRARSFKQLPNGSWFVTLWEESVTYGLELEKPSTNKPDRSSFMRVDVKPMRAEEFPKDIFNGPAFLEKAKKDGANVRTDG